MDFLTGSFLKVVPAFHAGSKKNCNIGPSVIKDSNMLEIVSFIFISI